MSEHYSSSGQYLCKAVSFIANKVEHKVGARLCTTCRTWAGGPLIGMDCSRDVELEGELTRNNSSNWAQPDFRQKCGTHLFYRFKGDGRYIMPAGVFNQTPDLIFDP